MNEREHKLSYIVQFWAPRLSSWIHELTFTALPLAENYVAEAVVACDRRIVQQETIRTVVSMHAEN